MLINLTRITVPSLPRIFLHRKRLNSLLKESLKNKLTIIRAGPGEGKTALVIDFVNTSHLQTVCYSLIPSDSDLVKFLSHLEFALHKVFPRYEQSTITRYLSLTTSLSSQIDQVVDILAAKLNEIVKTYLLVILDDYHLIHSDSNVHFFLAKLLEYSSPKVHFIIITRLPLHGAFAKFYIRQQVFEITKEDLRFTLQESSLLVNRILSSNLKRDKIEKLARICDGWVTGLILLSEHLESSDDEAENLPDESLRKLYSYLGEEIFKKLPIATQTVLIKTSILEEVTSELAQKLSGISKAKSIVDTFTKHYFLATRVASDTYRYHHLLRLFLQNKLNHKEIKRLHLKAASYYQAKRNNFIAIHHMLKAGCTKKAAHLLKEEGMHLLIKGQYENLASILKKFSIEDFQNNPWLLYFRALLSRWDNPSKALQELKTAINLFKQKRNNRDVVVSILAYVETSLMSGNIGLRPHRLIKQVTQAIEQKKIKFPSYLSPYILLSTSIIEIFLNGDLKRGLEFAQIAYKKALKENNFHVQIKALIFQGFAYYYMGEIEETSDIVKQLMRLIEEEKAPLDINLHIFHLAGMIYRLKGNITKAKGFLDKSIEIVKQLKTKSLYPFVFETMASVHIAQRKYLKARKSILELKSIGEETQNMWALALAQVNLLCFYLLTGKLAEALNLAPNLLKTTKKAGKGYFSLLARILVIATYAEAGKKELALRLLRNVMLKAKKMEAKYLILILHSEAAKLYFDLGKKRLFFKHLRNCLELMQNNPYRYFYNYRDSLYAFIAYQSISQGIYPEIGKDIIIIFLGPNGSKALVPYLKEAKLEVKEQLKKLIKKAFKYSAPIIHIRTLGDFEIKVGNKIITQWRSQKAKTLLKILITRGEKPIPVDVIMEDMWPEADWRSLKENFKITLRRLRRSLEPELPPRMNSSYVYLKNSCLYLNKEKILVDAWEFKKKVKNILYKKKEAFTEKDLEEIENIIEAYKGEFLPQDLYSEWASREREYLRNLYIRLLETAIFLAKNFNFYEKTVSYLELLIIEDPFNQKAYEDLMNCYIENRLYNKAIKLFKNFKKLLETELGISPSKKILELYPRILALMSH